MATDSRSWRGVQAGDYVSVEIKQEEENLILSIKERMESVSLSHCICRVPEKIYKENEENFYFPELVSIGPFHHGKSSLKATEDQKWRYLNTVLSRQQKVKASLDSCVNALKELEPKVRKCYGEEINLINSDELVEMMLVDGCFIIELLLKYSMTGLRRRDDPIFTTKGMFFRLRCDIIMLENQIPFFVLQRLFNLVPIPQQCTQSLTELALIFFRRMVPGLVQFLQGKLISQDFNHLLDLVHYCYLPTYPEVQSQVEEVKAIDPATKLREAGIGFKKATTESLLDIKFVRGILEIPSLKVNDYTEIILRNLIALEQCCCDRAKYITSYAFLMGMLVKSKNDMKLLHGTRILTNGLEREEEILDIFKKLPVELDAKEFYYNRLCEQLSGYRKINWRVWWQKAKQRYHRSPWGVAVFILAILFLVFTFTGTLFSVLSFSLHHHL